MASFRPVRCLHRHANAEILLCVDPETQELVVVKKIGLTACADSASLSLVPEAAVISKLMCLPQHANVLRYADVYRHDGVVLVTMEHCLHGDLLSWLEQQPNNRFSEPMALRLFRQAALGVQFLHAHGIAHRDLSLENLLVSQDRVLKICDFGLATLTACKPCNDVVGKKNYMAPEIAAGVPHDPVKADIWSLGIVLFILLTGSPLFAVADASDATFRVFPALGVAGVLRHWRMDNVVSPATVNLLNQLLCTEPSQRCLSMSELLHQLDVSS